MDMQEVNILKDKLGQALFLIKESVDISANLMKDSNNKELSQIWEEFLSAFIKYIRIKSKEIGKNMLASINFGRIWR